MTTKKSAQSAARIDDLIRSYAGRVGDDDLHTAAGDLICDVLHWLAECPENDESAETILARAQMHFDSETDTSNPENDESDTALIEGDFTLRFSDGCDADTFVHLFQHLKGWTLRVNGQVMRLDSLHDPDPDQVEVGLYGYAWDEEADEEGDEPVSFPWSRITDLHIY